MSLKKLLGVSCILAAALFLFLLFSVIYSGGTVFSLGALLLSAALLTALLYWGYRIKRLQSCMDTIEPPSPLSAFPNEEARLLAAVETFRQDHRSLLEVQEQMEAISRNLPGCLLRIRASDFQIQYVSSGCQTLTGFSPQQVMDLFGESFLLAVKEEDRDRTKAFLTAARECPREDRVLRFRPITADGRLTWLMGRLSLVSSSTDEPAFYGLILDITHEEKAQEDLRVSRERYRLILEQSDDIVCEWDFASDTFTASPKWEKRFSFPPPCRHFIQEVLSSPDIYPGDLPGLRDWLTETRRGVNLTTSVDIRIRGKSGRFMWNRLAASVILGPDGRPQRAVGLLQDIDKQRRELDSLRTSASTDPLTGIYNKAASRRLVEEYLAENDGHAFAALMILDVDNFKTINDTYGHLYGDSVLSDIASRLQGLFRDTDIVGRVGGDEFMVFLKNLPSCQLLQNKAENVIAMFREYFGDRCEGGVSCSLGMALYPLHGETFNDLYRRADLGLYSAKAQGKNCWVMFSPQMEEVDFPIPPSRS